MWRVSHTDLVIWAVCRLKADIDSDLLVKIVDVDDVEKVAVLSDNPKSVRSAAWDPLGQYLVSQHYCDDTQDTSAEL